MVTELGSIVASTSVPTSSSSPFVKLAGAAAVNAAIAGSFFGKKAAAFAAGATVVASALFGRTGAVITSAATLGLGLASLIQNFKSTLPQQPSPKPISQTTKAETQPFNPNPPSVGGLESASSKQKPISQLPVTSEPDEVDMGDYFLNQNSNKRVPVDPNDTRWRIDLSREESFVDYALPNRIRNHLEYHERFERSVLSFDGLLSVATTPERAEALGLKTPPIVSKVSREKPSGLLAEKPSEFVCAIFNQHNGVQIVEDHADFAATQLLYDSLDHLSREAHVFYVEINPVVTSSQREKYFSNLIFTQHLSQKYQGNFEVLEQSADWDELNNKWEECACVTLIPQFNLDGERRIVRGDSPILKLRKKLFIKAAFLGMDVIPIDNIRICSGNQSKKRYGYKSAERQKVMDFYAYNIIRQHEAILARSPDGRSREKFVIFTGAAHSGISKSLGVPSIYCCSGENESDRSKIIKNPNSNLDVDYAIKMSPNLIKDFVKSYKCDWDGKDAAQPILDNRT